MDTRHLGLRFLSLQPCTWFLTAFLVTVLWNATEPFNLDEEYPIIYEDPSNYSGHGSYFGYSLIMYSGEGKDDTSWIMVGAPRANTSFKEHSWIREPGQVYKCSLSHLQPCEPLKLDESGNSWWEFEGEEYHEYKDGAWIGAAMASKPAPDGRVVICGPRWINQIYKNSSGNIYQVGVCYWMPADNDVNMTAEKLLPLLRSDRFMSESNHTEFDSYKDFDFGEAGFSAYVQWDVSNKKQNELILGAPGIANWKGGVFLYKDQEASGSGVNKRSVNAGDFSKLMGPFIDHYIMTDNAYFGYQVSSGYFLNKNELLYVASAPRAANLKGKVSIFKLGVKGSLADSGIIIEQKFHGIQFGEYYGASLAVGDLNNDGFDDLIIGAPLYTKKTDGYDEGRISVIFGNRTKLGKLEEDTEITGKVAGGRFGTAISYLGKLDSDAFAEIGVGAPYEDNGRGVVYILSRSMSGRWDKIVQRLVARDIYPNLQGFGSSIVIHPADIDANGCQDVAVGAYKSGHAAIFRGRPVVKWNVINPHPLHKLTPRNATSLMLLDVCVSYQGKTAPGRLEVKRTMKLDSKHQRCRIKNKTIISDTIHLNKNSRVCENISITLMPYIRNPLDPIEIIIVYQFNEKNETKDEENQHKKVRRPIIIKTNGIEGTPDNFCKTCPISKYVPFTKVFIPFEVECGADNICEADLTIKGYFPELKSEPNDNNISFITGSSETLNFKVEVSNKLEPAYLTYVYIELGSPAGISRIPAACTEISSTQVSESVIKEFLSFQTSDTHSLYLQCDIGQLYSSSRRELSLELSVSNPRGRKGIGIRALVTTASEESNLSDNIWNMTLPLQYLADITIAGKTEKESYNYSKETSNEAESKITFLQTYEVQKFGFSPVEKVNIDFQIPFGIENSNNDPISFLEVKSVVGNEVGQSLHCKETRVTSYNEFISKYQSITGKKELLNVIDSNAKNIINNRAIQVPSNRTLYLNCSSFARPGDLRIICMTVTCEVGPFHDSQTVAKVKLSMDLDIKKLKTMMGMKDIISLTTLDSVTVIEPADLLQPEPNEADQIWTSSLFFGNIPPKKVESWLIVLAVVAGIVVLVLLGYALYKAGFFERKKKEELNELKKGIATEAPNEGTAPD